MPYFQQTAPQQEPVSLAEAKLDMRVDHDFTEHDSLIAGLLVAGREYAEMICRRALLTQQWRLVLDGFPAPHINIASANWYGPQWGNSPGPLAMQPQAGKSGYEIELSVSPVQSVDEVSYIDQAGVTQVLAPSAYKLDVYSAPARLTPAYGSTWPPSRNETSAVQIKFTSGFASPAEVPRGIKAAIIMHAKAHYEATFDDAKNAEYERRIKAVDALLQPYRVMSF